MTRGIFLNTEPAVCSIFESGKMVFDCLKSSPHFDLDYITLDQIDLDHLRSNQKLRLKSSVSDAGETAIEQPDFWVLNYHHHTMAPILTQDLLPYITGPRFSIVLEVEPEDPIRYVPANRFDSCMVLDPSAVRAEKVTPFPRPLRGKPREGQVRNREVPVIGSFGLGTPGKGFEHVVEAVNREFDRALVRINVPRAAHVDTIMYNVHQREYVDYLADLCKRIAKPGIEVEVTRTYLEAEELVDWCADNDLNCFFYNRRQSGLSATTDQCVISGQPLIVSSNDTFRHIHPYIAPYPKLSLREAMRSTYEPVRRMQRDWSIEAFQSTFVEMLDDCGIRLDTDATPLFPKGGAASRAQPATVVLATTDRKASDDPISFAQRVGAALGRTGEYKPVVMPYRDGEDFERGMFWLKPSAVLMCEPAKADLLPVLGRLEVPVRELRDAMEPDDQEAGRAAARRPQAPVRRPVVPYYTALPAIPPGPLRIFMFGLTAGDQRSNRFELLISKVQREAPDAVVLMGRLPSETDRDRKAFEEKLNGLRSHLRLTPALQVNVLDMQPDASSVIHTVGTAHLILFADNGTQTAELLDFVDLALTTERAVVFTRLAPFAGLEEGTFVEDAPLDRHARKGLSAQVALYNRYFEGRLFERLDRSLTEAFAESPDVARPHGWRPNGMVNAARSLPDTCGLLESEAGAWLAANDPVRSVREPDLAWAAEHAAAHVTAQQQFLVAAVERLCNWSRTARILGVGDARRASAVVLRKLGYGVTWADDRLDTIDEPFDCVFGSCALSGAADARDLFCELVPRLKIGGGGVFTFFHREAYADGDPRENPDFPVIAPDEMVEILESVGVEAVGPIRWRSHRPLLPPRTFEAPQVATVVFRKAGARPIPQRH